jgi:hypothetical protein
MAGPTVGANNAGTFRVNPMLALQMRQAQVAQTKENAGRHAVYEAVCESIATGSFLSPFIERPQLYYGTYIDASQLHPATLIRPLLLPVATGGVFQWVLNARGFYLGAHVYYVVSWAFTGDVTTLVVEHHFTFSGIATKGVSGDLLGV